MRKGERKGRAEEKEGGGRKDNKCNGGEREREKREREMGEMGIAKPQK